jgi:hypothetical protein
MMMRIISILPLVLACCASAPGKVLGEDSAAATAMAIHSRTAALCELQLLKPVPSQLVLVRKWVTNPEEAGEVEHRVYRVCSGQTTATVTLEGAAVMSIEVSAQGFCVDRKVCIGSDFRTARSRFTKSVPFMSEEEGRILSLRLNEWLSLLFATDGIGDECWSAIDSCRASVQRAKITSIFLSGVCLRPGAC